MRWRRRRDRDGYGGAAVGQAGAALVPAPRVERALVALAHQTQQLDDRLDRLERRLDASIDAGLDAPTHDDVVQVRVHSAKVAAELARMTVELRAEIDAAMAAAKEPTRYLTPEERRLHTVAETIIDLSDRLDTLPVDRDRRAASA